MDNRMKHDIELTPSMVMIKGTDSVGDWKILNSNNLMDSVLTEDETPEEKIKRLLLPPKPLIDKDTPFTTHLYTGNGASQEIPIYHDMASGPGKSVLWVKDQRAPQDLQVTDSVRKGNVEDEA